MVARRSPKLALWIALGVGAIYALAVGVLGVFYRQFMYPAPHSGRRPELHGAELVRVEAAAGPVFAFHAPAPQGAPTLVHFHGNGEELADQVWLTRALTDAGVGVFAVEYPGYGLAYGQATSERSIYAAAEQALDALYERGVARDSVVLMGQSLGSGVATEMATRGHGKSLVLVSPYTSMVAMVRRFVAFLPVSTLVDDRYDTLAKAPNVDLPVLVVHGDADTLIPVAMGREVAAAFPHAELHVVAGAGHNDLFAMDARLVPRVAAFAKGSRDSSASGPAPR